MLIPPDPWANPVDPDARTPGDELGPSELIRIELRQAMIDCWNSICTDTDCHPLDIEHQGKRLYFSPNHWADMVAAELSSRLSHHVSMRDLLLSGGLPETSSAINDIAAERRRQISQERWTLEHDDKHARGELAIAAACYASAPSMVRIEREWVPPDTPKNWPWHFSWWKPGALRRNLVKAGALIVAEIERLDRAHDHNIQGRVSKPDKHGSQYSVGGGYESI